MSSTYLYFAFFMSLALVAAFASATNHGGYGSHSDPNLVKPNLNKEKTLSAMIGVQGLVYCRSGPKRFPLQGAVVRITCLASDGSGYEAAPFSFLSEATDAKGYFFATLSPYEMQENRKIKECKAFLDQSPLETCNVPTDAKQGITGALLASYHYLSDKKMKLFTVGPFVYSSAPTAGSNY
ncbi:POLLEN OLE E 1 ALLERGEN AND EXTENSIN FAMILY PROTEIN [Salix viminalis]|nr:POLLEN OLE E 1 ALLERGEN AND EXTENSIN FAMILY PROTEIN [Salix viminalis]